MSDFFVQFIVGLVMILIIDLTYLSYSVPAIYKPGMGPLLKTSLTTRDKAIAFLAWPLLVYGLVTFAVQPAKTTSDALQRGMMLGLVVYGVYQFTNKSTLVFWGDQMMVLDLIWGTLLSGVVAAGVFAFRESFLAKEIAWAR